jgi:uncharacterized membrane protein YfhO
MNFHGVHLASITHSRLDMFLLGYIAAVSAAVALFFVRFWKETRDFLFLAFAVLFVVQGGTRAFALSTASPNLTNEWVYVFRLLAVLLVVAAILHKNSRSA